jgi:uncharacterized protein (TIGR02391 family)
MNLETTIDTRLWAAVQAAYEAGNYTGAILDSVHFLSDLIRNKSGLDSDGQSLVGTAFGGQDPIVKVNSLQTESDRDGQKGVEFLLRGLYTAIRNPRSHEKRSDSIETADVLLMFISYIVGLIDKSRSPFDTDQIIGKVFDRHFAQTEKYADLIVLKIPSRKRLEVLIQVFRRRAEGNGKSIVLFTYAVLKTLGPEDQATFWQTVSDALESAQSDAEYRTAIQIAQQGWANLTELAKIRAEHRLIESIKEGEYDDNQGSLVNGSLGTWALGIGENFSMGQELANALTSRLASENLRARNYVLKYFIRLLHALSPSPPWQAINSLRKGLRDHDKGVYDALSFLTDDPWENALDENDDWGKQLAKAYKEFQPHQEITDEAIPF